VCLLEDHAPDSIRLHRAERSRAAQAAHLCWSIFVTVALVRRCWAMSTTLCRPKSFVWWSIGVAGFSALRVVGRRAYWSSGSACSRRDTSAARCRATAIGCRPERASAVRRARRSHPRQSSSAASLWCGLRQSRQGRRGDGVDVDLRGGFSSACARAVEPPAVPEQLDSDVPVFRARAQT
jgi:hypothetical protein